MKTRKASACHETSSFAYIRIPYLVSYFGRIGHIVNNQPLSRGVVKFREDVRGDVVLEDFRA